MPLSNKFCNFFQKNNADNTRIEYGKDAKKPPLTREVFTIKSLKIT
jgi:hypothetical protein